ncbi:ChW repeat-/cell adhesion domain-containing transglutaminase-like protease [Clostridioides difficile]|uniref:transglutaminase-like domain-containing protein n=1 Tax=Clostridioides difficile TaxID=1496 RepID=UPI000D1EAC16|nr:transglutaminase-like domain-containing protein [Clostridioides difficile]UUC41664.1 transglutaminase-like domain-containing protein [Clostridioides difficile]VFC56487.1 ChW repeat-/cell adhesion domain-containing transglutaminase-like protease [Clostridioides difficile]VHX74988.1 ChW repeat-/cell adhesion domain-containing transglutaminase-like protease [Clostridioides difficile]VIF71347.1 ChW repeat-/cell adhesion domain-containing transglutaminase-like protease [Clostridioides difficile]
MKKIRKLATKLLITTMVLISGMSMTVYGMTAKEVTAKTPKSYVTGTNSVYGPKLSQAQLNSVAQATADFMNKKITKNMTTDAKILVAYNHIKNNTTYVDWNAVEGANTAYTLVTKKGACSGMARSMKALCDAMGIESYYVHSTSNDHQWNLIRFGDGRLYHVDIDANKSAGKDVIYKSLSHPLPFDKTAYPTVGAVAQTQKKPAPPGKHTMLPHQEGAKVVGEFGDIKDKHVMYEGVRCVVINSSVNTVTFMGSKSNLDPSELTIAVIGFMNTPYGMFALAPESKPVEYPFEYDKPFSLDFSGKNRSGAELAKYCKKNDVTIKIEITDEKANTGLGQIMYIRYE